jgi:hypothetical protein
MYTGPLSMYNILYNVHDARNKIKFFYKPLNSCVEKNMVEEPLGHDFNQFNSQKPHQLPTRPLHGVPVEVLHDLHHNSHQEGGYVVRSCVKGTQE